VHDFVGTYHMHVVLFLHALIHGHSVVLFLPGAASCLVEIIP
jgi:hypothetical protein